MPVLGVQLDHAPLLGGQRPVLPEQPGGHAQLADVVQDPGEAEHLDALVVHAQLARDHHGGLPDALAVPPRVPVLDVDGLDQRPDGRLVCGPFPVVLRERPPRDAHRQQHEQRGHGTVRAAPQDGHHQPGEAVHRDRRERARHQAPPSPPHRHPLRRGQDPAVQQREHQAERQHGRPGRPERVRDVARDDRVPTAEHPVHPGRRPHAEDELGGPPDPPQRHGPLPDMREQRTGHGDQGGGGRGQQESAGQQHGVEGPGRVGDPYEPGPGSALTAGVQRGEQRDRPPGRTDARQREQTEQGGDGDTGDVHTCTRGYRFHEPLPRPCPSGPEPRTAVGGSAGRQPAD